MAFNQRLIVVQTPINAREKRKRKKRSFAHFVFNFCSFRFCDYMSLPMIQVKIRTTERNRMAETVAEKLRIRLNNEETDFKRLDFKTGF